MLLQVLEIIYEVQWQMNNEKITKKEISFPTYKTCFFPFFFFFHFGLLLFSNFITFLFLIHFK
jgi:hypothetical protein